MAYPQDYWCHTIWVRLCFLVSIRWPWPCRIYYWWLRTLLTWSTNTNLTLYSSIVVAECCRGYCGSVLWDYWCPAVAKRCILWIIRLCGTLLPLAKHCQAISLLISCAGLLFARTNIKWDDPVSYVFMVTENGWLGLIMIFCSQICLWTWHSRSSVTARIVNWA